MNWTRFIRYIKENTDVDYELLGDIASYDLYRAFVNGVSPKRISEVYRLELDEVVSILSSVFSCVSPEMGDADISFYNIYTRTYEYDYFVYECNILSQMAKDYDLKIAYNNCEIFYNIERRIKEFYDC